MKAAQSHSVWKAVGLVVAGYIVLRMILVYLQARTAAASPGYYHFVGGGGGSGYVSGTTGSKPTAKTPTPKPPATGKPKKPKKSPSGKQKSKRFGDFVPVDNPDLYLGLVGMTGPVQYRGKAI